MSALLSFKYLEPSSVQQAIELLAKHDGSAALAGGTDLLVKMQDGKAAPTVLVSLASIPGLNAIGYEDGYLKIGALATHTDIEKSALIQRDFGLLADAARQIGSRQIRNVATIGGNLCNAAPSADTATPLLALNAAVRLVGPRGERIVPLEDFFAGPMRTVLERGEIMTEIRVPRLPTGSGGAFIKHSVRRAMDLALVSASAVVILDAGSGICSDARIAMGVAAPTPIRARAAESLAKGRELDGRLAEQVGIAAAEEARPRSSFRASAEYRRAVLKVLVKRVFSKAGERALAGVRC